MAKVFEGLPNPIEANKVIRSGHVSQSVDAFTAAEAYDITISGSLTVNAGIGTFAPGNYLENGGIMISQNPGALTNSPPLAFMLIQMKLLLLF